PRTGTASGVVQVIGGPVPPGTVARFSGTPANDEVVVLNCFVGGREYAVNSVGFAYMFARPPDWRCGTGGRSRSRLALWLARSPSLIGRRAETAILSRQAE